MENRNTSRVAFVYLNGYLKVYEQFCTDADCPIEKYYDHLKKGDENINYLFLHLEKLYLVGLAKFSNCVSLRIAYSYFLMDVMINSKQAIVELNKARLLAPKIDESFIIYRNLRSIEDQNKDNYFTDNQDIVMSIAYNNLFEQCICLS
jgi:hypothetical protein